MTKAEWATYHNQELNPLTGRGDNSFIIAFHMHSAPPTTNLLSTPTAASLPLHALLSSPSHCIFIFPSPSHCMLSFLAPPSPKRIISYTSALPLCAVLGLSEAHVINTWVTRESASLYHLGHSMILQQIKMRICCDGKDRVMDEKMEGGRKDEARERRPRKPLLLNMKIRAWSSVNKAWYIFI